MRVIVQGTGIQQLLNDANGELLADGRLNLWVEDASAAQLQPITCPLLDAALRCGDSVLYKQVGMLVCALVVLEEAAACKMWRATALAAGQGATALTAESAAIITRVKQAIDKMNDYTAGVCRESDREDVSLALAYTVRPIPFHVSAFDTLPWGRLVVNVRGEAKSVMSSMTSSWLETQQHLETQIKASLIPYDAHAEELLLPERRDLVKQILTNPGYAQLTELCTALIDMAKLDMKFNIFPKGSHERAKEVSDAGLRLVSLTFTLYHVAVAWPRLRGQKTQATARDDLVRQHETSVNKNSWSSLPEAIKAAVLAFGADAKQASGEAAA